MQKHPSLRGPTFIKKARVAVIGAGPAGLAAADRLLSAQGVEVHVYEAQNDVGGLCRSLHLWGHIVDLGPHRFFSASEEVNHLWFRLVGDQFSWVPRQTRIFYKGRFFEYPLQAWNTLTQLGGWGALRGLSSYIGARCFFRAPDSNFENWAIRRFGKYLYRLFFKTYSQKLWGLPCDQIDPDFAYRKIRGLSVAEVIRRFFSNSKKTFVDVFAYPTQGTGSIYQKMAKRLQERGGTLLLNSPVSEIKIDEGVVSLLSHHQWHSYDHVISTMPLNQLVALLPAVPEAVQAAARDLSFRNTILVYLWVAEKNLFPDNWIYVHSPDVEFGRITNFNNWGLVSQGEGTVLCLEYWCHSEDLLWKQSDQEISEKARQELLSSQLVPSNLLVRDSKVVRIAKSYPVFKVGYREPLNRVKDFLQKVHPNFCSIGRYGAFKYNNQDHSLLMGLRAADQFLFASQKTPDGVNTETSYEEDFELSDVRYDHFDEI